MDLSSYNKPVNLSGPSNFFGNLSARSHSTGQMVLQHGMNMEAAHHGNELAKDYATHAGNIQSALSAQEHGQTSALSLQEHGQRIKETAATNRHVIKKTILDHRNELETRAVDHHNSTNKLRTESGLRVSEAVVAHKHAGELMERIAASGQGGTPAEFSGNGIKAKLTLKIPSAPGTNPTPTVAPRQTKSFVGMPGNRASTPQAAPSGPQPTVKRAPNGRMVSMNNSTPTSAPAKKAAAKKAAPTKGQPTVTRDKTTGRMIGIKKK